MVKGKPRTHLRSDLTTLLIVKSRKARKKTARDLWYGKVLNQSDAGSSAVAPPTGRGFRAQLHKEGRGQDFGFLKRSKRAEGFCVWPAQQSPRGSCSVLPLGCGRRQTPFTTNCSLHSLFKTWHDYSVERWMSCYTWIVHWEPTHIKN